MLPPSDKLLNPEIDTVVQYNTGDAQDNKQSDGPWSDGAIAATSDWANTANGDWKDAGTTDGAWPAIAADAAVYFNFVELD